jgi:diguanylate cyclase (GGDEF)-like protein
MFEEFLRMAVVRAKRNGTAVAVLYIDLDDFKLVNDTLGHGPGDELLRQVAERLRDSARQSDLVARQGGDEFLLLVTDVDPASGSVYRPETNKAQLKAESVAGRIQDALRDSFRLGDSEVYVTASIGISVFPVDAPDAENLLKNADTAMYLSKRVAPGGYMVFSGRQQIEAGKLSMATRLRQAVEAQQWELHYQPVLELATGAMEGVEALVRWRDPTGGLVAPGEFIPLAEEMGLIGAIGDWVLEELCRQAKEWAAVGLPLDVSFNVSPRQLWQPDVVSEILGRVRDAELSPERVIVEITESAAMADPERTQRLFRELQEQGVRLAIDDFGTGFSSLARLKQLPVDILKIDQMFVRDMTEATHSASMVRAVIDLAHGLGMIAQAEGIETEEQWKFLAEYGCELGQGYHFSRPVPGDQILTYARRRALALPVQR